MDWLCLVEGVKTRGAKLVGILGLVDFPAGVGNLVEKFWRGTCAEGELLLSPRDLKNREDYSRFDLTRV